MTAPYAALRKALMRAGIDAATIDAAAEKVSGQLPGARRVITPHGTFPSAAAAARALGISKQAVSEQALLRRRGWRYADDKSPAPPPPKRGRPVGWRKGPDGEWGMFPTEKPAKAPRKKRAEPQ
jgi:hypothetical protein